MPCMYVIRMEFFWDDHLFLVLVLVEEVSIRFPARYWSVDGIPLSHKSKYVLCKRKVNKEQLCFICVRTT